MRVRDPNTEEHQHLNSKLIERPRKKPKVEEKGRKKGRKEKKQKGRKKRISECTNLDGCLIFSSSEQERRTQGG